MHFHGTYLPTDVNFLLTNINIPNTSIEEKESNIQKNNIHYSEMISYEKSPSLKYKEIFNSSFNLYSDRFSSDLVTLANKIIDDFQNKDNIVLVSLARAGTPIGVILKRYLTLIQKKPVSHYCVSIIRDVGLDLNAIKYILNHHKDSEIAFIDGWTGKGVIGKQLDLSITTFNKQFNYNISSNLYVVLDISGTAYFSASQSDYLIPSAILNSTISGLISRTIYNKKYLKDNDFHGFVFYDYLIEDDISTWFVEKTLEKMIISKFIPLNKLFLSKVERQFKSSLILEYFMNELNIDNINYIKPGVGESSRVLLRRVPDKLYVSSLKEPSIQHLILLANEKNVEIIEKKDLFYNAVAIIKQLD